MVDEFSIDRVQKKSAVFDEIKLQWISGQHIYKKSPTEILNGVRSVNSDWRVDEKEDFVIKVIDLMKERVKSLNDMQEMTEYFFTDPTDYDKNAVKKKWKDETVNALIEKFIDELKIIKSWEVDKIENSLRNLSEKEEVSPGKIIHPTRLAISGTSSGPSLFEMMEVLGKETCIRRLKNALTKLPIIDND